MKKIITSPVTYIVLAVILAAIFWDNIVAAYNKIRKVNGTPCKKADGQTGTYHNSLCISAAEAGTCDENKLGFQKNGFYNPEKCGRPAPAEGTTCFIGGKPGTIVNGTCVPAASAQRIVLVPISSSRIGRRRARCYSKPAGAQCDLRIYEAGLGWGSLYSSSSTTCCYIF